MRVRLLLLLLFPAALSAQLHLTARVGVADHSGHARDQADPEEPTFGPGVSRDFAASLGFDRGPWRVAVVVRREAPDLVLAGETTGIITRNALVGWQGGAELGRRVLGGPAQPSVHALVGGGVTRWSFPGFDDPARNRLSGWLALDGALPLGGHLDGALRIEVMTASSLFETADLPEGYASMRATRAALSVGIRWRR